MDNASCGDTVNFRHEQVDQEQVRFGLDHEVYSLTAIVRFADYVHSGLIVEKRSQALTQDDVIVCKDESDGHEIEPSSRPVGRRTVTVVANPCKL
jgi:hypothetical protein